MADLPFYLIPKDQERAPARRLVVLVSGGRLDEYRSGRLVWELALRGPSDVLFLSVVHRPGEELEVSRRLAKLASVAKDPRFQVSTQIQFGVSWPVAVRKVSRPGDQYLCLQDRVVHRWLARKDSLARWLSAELKLPVYVIR